MSNQLENVNELIAALDRNARRMAAYADELRKSRPWHVKALAHLAYALLQVLVWGAVAVAFGWALNHFGKVSP